MSVKSVLAVILHARNELIIKWADHRTGTKSRAGMLPGLAGRKQSIFVKPSFRKQKAESLRATILNNEKQTRKYCPSTCLFLNPYDVQIYFKCTGSSLVLFTKKYTHTHAGVSDITTDRKAIVCF
jgi:hypothetical protein